MYTWDHIVKATLAKLDLDQDSGYEANVQGYVGRFITFANEAMTQICNAIKPKRTFVEITVYDVNDNSKPDDAYLTYTDININEVIRAKNNSKSDFISFSDSPSYCKTCYLDSVTQQWKEEIHEVHDSEVLYHGYNSVMFLKPGHYLISYKARWFTFDETVTDNPRTELDIPDDVVDCIPSYIASQCYKVDDEYKAQVFRNEYEMFLARVDNTDFDNTTTFEIGGDW